MNSVEGCLICGVGLDIYSLKLANVVLYSSRKKDIKLEMSPDDAVSSAEMYLSLF